ncbi:MAG: hypothetical protein MUQ32_08335, partial [Chloroflexi bacterium]|nr:hypothetical protein [Chloroflexota bacterium]
AMGLYGTLIVRPTGFPTAPGRAYSDASTAFDDEALVVLGEVDPNLNNSATPWTVDLRAYAPRYFLVNGQAYSSTAPSITTTSGNRLLLRYANAGIQHHSIGVLGLHQAVLATDGSELSYPRTMVAETLAPGSSTDVLITMPATTETSTKYAVYDAAMTFNNSNSTAAGLGGMLALIDASGTAGGDTVGPITSGVTLDLGTGALAASVSDVATGNANVAAAEYFIDATGATGTGTAMSGTFGSPTVAVSATIPPAILAGLTSGSHTVFVRGQDSLGNWGVFSSTILSIDTTGPTTSALVLNPNPSNGSVSVALSGTASDVATGGGNVVAAEYFIGAPGTTGTGATVIRNNTAPTVSLAATIPAGSSGVISVHAQDAAGNWGPYATITLIVDSAGPSTSGVTASPNPNNGTLGVSGGNPSVRVVATFDDTASGATTIATGEGFIDTVGANGTGFPFVASDGAFNTAREAGYADVPLTTINLLSSGNHTIYVHAKDAAGNWGTTSTTILVIDKAAPTISSVTLTPSTVAFEPGTTQLNVTAADAGTGVSGGQYWIDGTATPPASPTTFTGTSVAINTGALAGGNHTVYVRVRDGAQNWSSVSSATLTVVRAVNDSLTINANTSATQTSTQAAPGVLANDLPIGLAGRTATLASSPVRTSGSGAGTIAVTLNSDGSYTVTLTGVGGSGNARRASKQGTFQFTYTLTLNGVTSTATVTITV